MENWISQIAWFANLYIQFLDYGDGYEISIIKKFAKFCSQAGYEFPIYDKDGNMIGL
jgi:hypothetical protein